MHLCVPASACICMFVRVRCWYACIHIYASVSRCTLMHACMSVSVCVHVSACLCVCEQLTFVSDEVSAEDDEEAEQYEDDNSHHPSDHGVVHPRRGRHGCGVLRGGCGGMERRGEERRKVKGEWRKSCSKDKKRGVIREGR